MRDSESASDIAAATEIARHADLRRAIQIESERSLRSALVLSVQDPRSPRRLSAVRSTARAFERHLARTRALTDRGAHMKTICGAAPQLYSQIAALKSEQERLQLVFENLVSRLDVAAPIDGATVAHVCGEIALYLDELESHHQQEMGLHQLAVNQDVGGER